MYIEKVAFLCVSKNTISSDAQLRCSILFQIMLCWAFVESKFTQYFD